jgi:cysteine dioxygenase
MAVNIASSHMPYVGTPFDAREPLGNIPTDRFDRLVLALKKALGPSSGLTSDDVDVDFLHLLMEDYDGTDGRWARYAFGDGSRGYTRNLVDEGNGKSNLVS